MTFPEKYRFQHPNKIVYPDTKPGDPYGFFLIPIRVKLGGKFEKKLYLFCLATSGTDEVPWEHVSISVKDVKLNEANRTPTWEEMCLIKNIFWDSEENVIQFHPPESEYVSHHKFTLHLWKKWGDNWETPPSEAIGTKKGQDIKQIIHNETN